MKIENLIINTWKKIPGGFKDRFKDLKITLDEIEKEGEPNRLLEFSNNEIIIYRKPIEKRFQREMDKIIIAELSRYFGFKEDEAYHIIKKNEN